MVCCILCDAMLLQIPASAVEMPGHIMPQLDVQFGVDFGTESSSFSFGSSDSIPQNSYSNSVTNRWVIGKPFLCGNCFYPLVQPNVLIDIMPKLHSPK